MFFSLLVSGLGFGIMSGIFAFVNTLSNALGPGIVGIHGDSPHFFINAGMYLLVVNIQTCGLNNLILLIPISLNFQLFIIIIVIAKMPLDYECSGKT